MNLDDIDTWIESRIIGYQKLIDDEMERIQKQYDLEGRKNLYPNMGTTNTLAWKSKIEAFEELQEFLGD